MDIGRHSGSTAPQLTSAAALCAASCAIFKLLLWATEFSGLRRCVTYFLIKQTKKIGLFSNTIKKRSFKLCMIINLLEFHINIVDLMTLTLMVTGAPET